MGIGSCDLAVVSTMNCDSVWMNLSCSDTYAEARARLLRATETSTLETDDEESAARSRMKRKKTFSDVEADDEFEGRPPPKLSKVTKKCAATISAEVPVPRGLHYGGITCLSKACGAFLVVSYTDSVYDSIIY